MVRQVGVVLAGMGVVGRRRYQCLLKNKNVKILGVCDKIFADPSKHFPNVPCFKDYKELLRINPDAAVICMSNDMSAEVTTEFLLSGAHVFCEKPPARSLEEMKKIKYIYDALPKKLVLKYGFNHRYHRSVIASLDIIRGGSLGRLLNMRGVYGKSKLITFNQSDWRTKPEIAGGGVLLDQGVHMLDLMLLFGDGVNELHAFIDNSMWEYGVEDNAYILMRSVTGITSMLHSSATLWRHKFELELTFARGSISLQGILSGSKSYGDEKLVVAEVDPESNAGDPVEVTTKYNDDPSWMAEMNEFIDLIISHNHDERQYNGNINDALDIMIVIDRIYKSDPKWLKKKGSLNA